MADSDLTSPENSSLLHGSGVALLVADGAEEIEYVHPRSFLERHGAAITTLSPKPESESVQTYARSQPAGQFRVDLDIRNAQPNEFDALVVPGGLTSPVKLRVTRSVIDFIHSFGEQHRTIGAICHAPGVLIEADLVRGRRVTSWPSLREDLERAGAEWVDEPVVVDGHLVTARRPEDLAAFEEALLDLLTSPTNYGNRS